MSVLCLLWCFVQATAAGLKMLAQELTSGGGAAAAQLRVAEQYVEVRAARTHARA